MNLILAVCDITIYQFLCITEFKCRGECSNGWGWDKLCRSQRVNMAGVYLISGTGWDGTGWFWKIHVSNYQDAGTVTENSILPKVRDEQDCIMKASILPDEIQTLASYPSLLAPGLITCNKACFFALLGGHSSIVEHIWFKKLQKTSKLVFGHCTPLQFQNVVTW